MSAHPKDFRGHVLASTSDSRQRLGACVTETDKYAGKWLAKQKAREPPSGEKKPKADFVPNHAQQEEIRFSGVAGKAGWISPQVGWGCAAILHKGRRIGVGLQAGKCFPSGDTGQLGPTLSPMIQIKPFAPKFGISA